MTTESDPFLLEIDAGGDFCQQDDNGFYPMHLAAKNASRSALEALITLAEKNGQKKEALLGQCDRERNTPLHAAVNSGDYQVLRFILSSSISLQTVALCLEHGARVDARQETRATSLHLACSQGSMDIVKLLYETYAKQNEHAPDGILHATDICGMTPLHVSAMFDHPTIIEYLLDMVQSRFRPTDSPGRLDRLRRQPAPHAAASGGDPRQ